MARGTWEALRPQWVEDSILKALAPGIQALVRTGVDPNVLTTLGFLVGVGAGVAFYGGSVRLAGFLVLLGGVLDIFDGRVARGTGQASVFGSFYDSTLDRISEIIVFVGITALFIGGEGAPTNAAMIYITAAALGGSLMVSYTRAKAEALGLDCKVGLMQRAERIFLVGVAALVFGWMWEGLVLKLVLIAVAVLSNFTAFQRIAWVYRHARMLPPPPTRPEHAAPLSTPVTGKREL
ncbi:MAG TPA: CDP-alcohol phosphatidyltransferase family protein [Longimicrobiaceae bacterium]|nr:CDP-alcohol phosphatidyltransferase family protein [Longimicrobiaceae bacterium]